MFIPYYMKHLATFVPVPPLLRPVDSALASGLQVFDALWSADSRAQGLEPTNRKVTDYNDSGHGNKKKPCWSGFQLSAVKPELKKSI